MKMSVFGKTQKFINSKHVPSFKSPEFVRKRNVCKSPISSDEELNSPLVKLRYKIWTLILGVPNIFAT